MAIEQLMRLECFEAAWKKICTYTVDCTNEIPESEVGETAVNAAVMLLLRCAEPTAVPLTRAVWEATLDAVERVLRAIVSRDVYRTTPPVLTTAVADLAGLVERRAAFFEAINSSSEASEATAAAVAGDVGRIVDAVFPLALLPVDDYFDSVGMSALQRAVFDFFAKVEANFHANPLVLERLLAKLADYPAQAPNPKLLRQATNTALLKGDERRLYTVLKVGCVGAERCAALFESPVVAAAQGVRAKTLPAVARALGSTALTARFAPAKVDMLVDGLDELWKYAQRALVRILVNGGGFEAIRPSSSSSSSSSDAAGNDVSDAWNSLFEFFAGYLAKAAEAPCEGERSAAEGEDDQKLDAELIAAITVEGVVKCGADVPGLDTRLADILLAGCRAAALSKKRVLCQGFYHALFTAAATAAPVSREALVDITLPLAYELATEVIGAYNADSESPEKATAMEALLCELVDFKTKDATFLAPPKKKEDENEKKMMNPLSSGNTERSFLLLLLSQLFSVTLLNNTPHISDYLKKILGVVGSEFLGL